MKGSGAIGWYQRELDSLTGIGLYLRCRHGVRDGHDCAFGQTQVAFKNHDTVLDSTAVLRA